MRLRKVSLVCRSCVQPILTALKIIVTVMLVSLEGLHQGEQHPRGPLTNQQVTAGRPNAGDQAETKLGRDNDGPQTR